MRLTKDLFVALAATALFFAGCGNSETTEDQEDVDTTAVVSEEAEEEPAGPKPGEIPYDFPVVSTNAQAGQTVLTPSRSFLDDAFEDPNSTFIFYSSKCVEPGEAESKIQQVSDEVMIPNSLVIPIPAGQEAQNGDILLTWWQSGSGMQRAIVVDAADPKAPVIKYLDLDNDKPEEQIEENSFVKLSGDWEPGTIVACKDGAEYTRLQVIRIEGDKLLGKAFAGKLKVVKKADCTPVPLQVDVKAGDEVQVPHLGSFTKGTVKSYDQKNGRVITEIEFAGEPKEIAVPVGDVMTGLAI